MSFLKELKENLKDANLWNNRELLKKYEDTLKGHDWYKVLNAK